MFSAGGTDYQSQKYGMDVFRFQTENRVYANAFKNLILRRLNLTFKKNLKKENLVMRQEIDYFANANFC